MKVIYSFKTHKGNAYQVILKKNPTLHGQKCFGKCEPPNKKGSRIIIAERQDDEELVDSLIHELSHAFFCDASEPAVRKFSRTLVSLLEAFEFKTIRGPSFKLGPETHKKKSK